MSSYKVLVVFVICKFLSCLGAKGFLIFELPLGSMIFRVIGIFYPFLYSLRFARKFYIWLYCSIFSCFLISWAIEISSSTLSRRPSIVVISAFLLSGISRSSSGIVIFAYYDLMISLLRSYFLITLNKISTP